MKNFKKLFAVLLTVAMLICSVSLTVNATEEEDDVIEIYTVEDLYCVRYDLDGHYRLMADIDLTEATAKGGDWDNEGYGWLPIGNGSTPFSGIFDGNGHAIIGMQINNPNYNKYGLFGFAKDASFFNLRLKNFYLYRNNLNKNCLMGALGGYFENCAVEKIGIENVTFKLNKVGHYDTTTRFMDYCDAAGLVCKMKECNVTQCFVTGTFDFDDNYSRLAGIAMAETGANKISVTDCYADVSFVKGANAHNTSMYGISDCVNSNCVFLGSCARSSSGISSYSIGGTYSHCYVISGSNGEYDSSPEKVTVLTEKQMTLPRVFGYLDFDNIWFMDTATGIMHPQLRAIPEKMTPVLAITNQPADVLGEEDTEATFTVDAVGVEPTYQWQVNDGSDWTDLSGASEATLTVTVSAENNGYQYRCVVADVDDQEVISEAATLTKKAAVLAIKEHPINYAGTVNEYTTLTVKASGENLTYQWQVDTTGTGWKNVTSSGYNKSAIKVQLTLARNGYQYRCVVTDGDGNSVISNPAMIFAREAAPAKITAQPQNYTGAVNTTATLAVTATGSNLKYQWQVNTGAGWKNVTSAGYNKASMSVTLTSARNGYQYRCIVTNSSGSVTSDAATIALAAAEALSITTQPQNYTGAVNTTATFAVKATGANLKYQWQVNTGSGWKNVTSTGYNKASMNVTLTNARNGYQYRCVVTNGSESVTSNAAKITIG